MAMSVDFSSPVIFPEQEEIARTISSDVLIDIASLAIEKGLSPINDLVIDTALIEPYGEMLWSNRIWKNSFFIHNILATCDMQETPLSLFKHPIKWQGTFYYLAPILSENETLVAIIILASQTVNNTLLLALTQSIAREISEKIKCHLQMQDMTFDNCAATCVRGLNIHEIEKSAIIEAAKLCNGKIQQMYQVLNMGRTTLWRKLKQYDIDIKEYK
ncbi:helix-turn-helix domain-containing protein [Providencia stuartii]|uniref:helix-turn-helix domain-containing protein n=2 Tax=Providencia TaxID=586 RepID=UPI001E2EB2A0|nr:MULTISPECIES: helix-turn-helix domain-containing protein [Providencia]WBA58014.1 transcriptional regulator [Providencia sp. 21OH12SH02B-Prov]WER23259.1 helix-turn-helix domain-containing protein [Providencia stuartii]WER27379.1 helix-turn-helix domain-containing protein [Providencia stuartii]WER31470.1 helix-turn-helix domain-containing protein [Providencia stuartii]